METEEIFEITLLPRQRTSFENAFIDEEEKGQVGNETKECQRYRRCYGLNKKTL